MISASLLSEFLLSKLGRMVMVVKANSALETVELLYITLFVPLLLIHLLN